VGTIPITLNTEDERLAAKAVDWFVREGVSEDRVRAIAIGEIEDPEFAGMVDLRERLRDLTTAQVVIGRRAFDYVRSISWDDEAVESVLARTSPGQTRVTLRAPREVMALFAECLRERADLLLADGDRLDSRRFATASRQLAARAK
jgi:hypothetical protein